MMYMMYIHTYGKLCTYEGIKLNIYDFKMWRSPFAWILYIRFFYKNANFQQVTLMRTIYSEKTLERKKLAAMGM